VISTPHAHGALRAAAALTVLVSLLLVAGCGGSAPEPRTDPIAPDLAIATFDSAWALIDRNHFDPDHGGVDWKQVRADLRPRAQTDDQDTLRAVITEMISRTGLSHFGLMPADAADALREAGEDDADDAATSGGADHAGVGLETRVLDDRLVIVHVDEGLPAAEAGIAPGWILEGVGTRTFAELFERVGDSLEPADRAFMVWTVANGLLRDAAGTDVTLTVRDGEDEMRELTLTRVEMPGTVNKLGNLPALNARLDHRWLEHEGLRIGYIRFNIWLLPVAAEFDAAVDAYRDADGIIIDLRGNLGGVGGMAMGLAGHFLDEPLSLGEMRTRQSSLQFRANPRLTNPAGERVDPFGGPLAILQDGLSMSTSEIFAQGLKAQGRARIFGETSGGAALPSRLEQLPNGDVLQYAFADFVAPDGVRLEGHGVIPDTEVRLRRTDLLAGRDAVLDVALDWIASAAHDDHAASR
jgi:carboxyl-terminal processing protease